MYLFLQRSEGSVKGKKFIIYLSYSIFLGVSWSWSYGSWIYNYLCNRRLSPQMLWVRITLRARCTTFCDKVCQWRVAGQWFSLVSSTNKTDCHDIAEIFLKVALNTINLTFQFSWLIGMMTKTLADRNCRPLKPPFPPQLPPSNTPTPFLPYFQQMAIMMSL